MAAKKATKKRGKAARKKAANPKRSPKARTTSGGDRGKSAKAPAKAKKKASRRGRVSTSKRNRRPKPKHAPKGLRRGTDAYRAWELGEVLVGLGTGKTKGEIVAELGMTPEEWRGRTQRIREDTRPGDALLVWARYAISTRARMAAAERILQTAITPIMDEVIDPETGQVVGRTLAQAPNLNAAVGALRLLAELDRSAVDMALKVGVFRPHDSRGDGGPKGPQLSTGAEHLIAILEAAGLDGGLEAFQTGDLEVASEKITREVVAIRKRPAPPRLTPGG